MEMNGRSSASYPARTLCVPALLLVLIGLEAKGLLDFQGQRGFSSVVWWNLRPVMFGVYVWKSATVQLLIPTICLSHVLSRSCPVLCFLLYVSTKNRHHVINIILGTGGGCHAGKQAFLVKCPSTSFGRILILVIRRGYPKSAKVGR